MKAKYKRRQDPLNDIIALLNFLNKNALKHFRIPLHIDRNCKQLLQTADRKQPVEEISAEIP